MEIIISDLTKRFGEKIALDNISLEINEGMFGLLGRNGAGKTTLMRIIATLLNKTDGLVKVCGHDIDDLKEIKKIIGYLPQDFSIYPSMTVYEAMDYLAVLSEINLSDRKERIKEILKLVNLYEYKKIKVKALSGGMKRRLGIAQAILNNPKVLIVDEPTVGLDPEERVRFRNLLVELAKNRIVILSTHIVGDIESTCKNIAVLDEGRLIYTGTVTELKEKARGKVYTKIIDPIELVTIKEKNKVIGMVNLEDKLKVRILSEDRLGSEYEMCSPNVEDAYMYLVGGNINV